MAKARKAALRELDLEQGRPQVSEALRFMAQQLKLSRDLGYAAVKLIHGYGSSGKGGKIRVTVRAKLQESQLDGVGYFIPGERFSIFDEETRRAFLVCDELRRDPDLDRGNNGITIVVLK